MNSTRHPKHGKYPDCRMLLHRVCIMKLQPRYSHAIYSSVLLKLQQYHTATNILSIRLHEHLEHAARHHYIPAVMLSEGCDLALAGSIVEPYVEDRLDVCRDVP